MFRSGRIFSYMAAVAIALWLAGPATSERKLNGFTLDPSSIPTQEILAGGPARDGIPALDNPKHVSARLGDWAERDLVLGIDLDGDARAYPIAILNWHEIVNDSLGGHPILVSFCPLCRSGMVFDRLIAGRAERFGVSGLLYRSDVLMYDRASESLWSQIKAEAVTGPRIGERLKLLRSSIVRWDEWRRAHPATTILTRETGHRRDYDFDPYSSYAESRALMFSAPRDERFHPKMATLGLRLPGRGARAYPAEEVTRAGGKVVEEVFGLPVSVTYDPALGSFRVEAPVEIEVVESFWFAWAAFHPESTVYRSPSGQETGTRTDAE